MLEHPQLYRTEQQNWKVPWRTVIHDTEIKILMLIKSPSLMLVFSKDFTMKKEEETISLSSPDLLNLVRI